MELFLYFDGASKGNPGPAGAGAWIFSKNRELNTELHKGLGEKTNNQAEYIAIKMGLDWILEKITKEYLEIEKINIFGDSQLVVRQLTGLFKVKNKNIIPYYESVQAQIHQLKEIGIKFYIKHIPREENSKADKLANVDVN